ncbi:DUF397 domain-containing protein [Streptomyces carpaticus]|uniref:DUF397 domain-containing protein n=1 Tax=Streptomyces cheonanensis TaxID=312720 RepID=A0ABN2VEL2_9ACTN|nr:MULTISPECIES: DUF397 domain-containing protein [Streptomyces]UWM48214.1 DUF397 domain-containing protein [Streptomyces carpaticus]
MTESPHWFKSSYSDNGGVCVEVAANLAASHGVVPVRDSKNPNGAILRIPVQSFATLVANLKSGGGVP